LMVAPRYASAISFILLRTIEEIYLLGGELLLLTLVLDHDHRLVARASHDFERP
jgi:hypothetical protein